jgi:hypothetical protein
MIVACVRTGERYGMDYVRKLRNMVSRHLKLDYQMVCLTDQPERCEAVWFVDIGDFKLPGWWAKMLLFEPTWRQREPVLFFDLDTVIINDISPLAVSRGELAILESPVRRAGVKHYPCKYNSSCLTIGPGMAAFIWDRFDAHRAHFMEKHKVYGDQACIQELYPGAPFLQTRFPGMFLNYRDLTMHRPQASVINFAGKHKPDNCDIPWVQKEWA